MSRDFSKNVSNFLDLGTGGLVNLVNGAAKISFHAICTFDAWGTTGNGDRIFSGLVSGANTGIMLGNAGATQKLRVGGRSFSGDTFRTGHSTTTITTGVEYCLGGVLDIVGDRIRVYVNGVQETDVAAAFTNAAFTVGSPSPSDYLGGVPSATGNQTDGRGSEFAIWAGDIGTAGFEDLYDRESADRVEPDLLRGYWPCWGTHSPEPNLRGGSPGTVNGSLPSATHPIIYRRPRSRIVVPRQAAAITWAPQLTMMGVG